MRVPLPIPGIEFLPVLLAIAIPVSAAVGQTASDDDRFTHSNTCATCHDNTDRARAMRDAKGRGIAPFDLWRASMMANAARDPFWRAMVSAEVAANPEHKAAIESKCMRCHAPMTRATDDSPQAEIAVLDDRSHPRHDLALDSVSCSVCHQISKQGLGTDASFTGHFEINDSGHAYGPHAEPFAMPMIRHSGLRPTKSDHILESALCGSCHTLDTHTLDAEGKATGSLLPEQSPYLEWRNSDFSTEREEPTSLAASCQECHMPRTDVDGERIATAIAHNPGDRDWPFLQKRSPYGRHIFIGGNALIPQILRDNKKELEVDAPLAAFDATIAAVKDQIRRRTAEITIGNVIQRGDDLGFTVHIENKTGHKFPSAYPSRRAWLHVRVTNDAGKVVFESGHSNDDGQILGDDGQPLAAESVGQATFPHRSVVRAPEEVVVYEAVMAGEDDAPTYRLLRGASYHKDNRILPKGWRPDGPHAAQTRPAGIGTDVDFTAGEDTVAFRIPATAAAGPYRIEVELLYQTLGARFAAELFTVDTKEVRRFQRMFAKADRRPLLVDRAAAASK